MSTYAWKERVVRTWWSEPDGRNEPGKEKGVSERAKEAGKRTRLGPNVARVYTYV